MAAEYHHVESGSFRGRRRILRPDRSLVSDGVGYLEAEEVCAELNALRSRLPETSDEHHDHE